MKLPLNGLLILWKAKQAVQTGVSQSDLAAFEFGLDSDAERTSSNATQLPPELLCDIFALAVINKRGRNDMLILLRIAHVCKMWRRIILGYRPFWDATHLDLSTMKRARRYLNTRKGVLSVLYTQHSDLRILPQSTSPSSETIGGPNDRSLIYKLHIVPTLIVVRPDNITRIDINDRILAIHSLLQTLSLTINLVELKICDAVFSSHSEEVNQRPTLAELPRLRLFRLHLISPLHAAFLFSGMKLNWNVLSAEVRMSSTRNAASAGREYVAWIQILNIHLKERKILRATLQIRHRTIGIRLRSSHRPSLTFNFGKNLDLVLKGLSWHSLQRIDVDSLNDWKCTSAKKISSLKPVYISVMGFMASESTRNVGEIVIHQLCMHQKFEIIQLFRTFHWIAQNRPSSMRPALCFEHSRITDSLRQKFSGIGIHAIHNQPWMAFTLCDRFLGMAFNGKIRGAYSDLFDLG